MTDGFSVDDRVQMLLTRAKSDPEAAAEALRWIARSLRKYGKMPQGLADHLADAIDASMGKPAQYRAKALTDELGLTANNRRPAADVYEVGTHIRLLMHEKGLSMSAAAGEVAHDFGISDATARNYYKTFVSGGEWEVVPRAESFAHK
jgi:hypothetical protein